jgi:hypothetical protein
MGEVVKRIAKKVGAVVVADLPQFGGGAFGAARLAAQQMRLKSRSRTRQARTPNNG